MICTIVVITLVIATPVVLWLNEFLSRRGLAKRVKFLDAENTRLVNHTRRLTAYIKKRDKEGWS